MKVIDLLNDLSTGKDIPKKIQVGEYTYKLVNEEELYYETEDHGRLNFDWFIETRKLNDDEIECLDKLHLYYYVDNRVEEETGEITFNNLCDIIGNQRIHEDKINELEKRVEELEKK